MSDDPRPAESEERLAALRARVEAAAASPRVEGAAEMLAAARRALAAPGSTALAPASGGTRARIEELADVLEDGSWTLPASVRRRLLALVACVADAEAAPAAGPPLAIDDALLDAFLGVDLAEEIEGYRAFRRFRDDAARSRSDAASRERALALERKRLRARIQGRRMRRELRHESLLRRLLRTS